VVAGAADEETGATIDDTTDEVTGAAEVYAAGAEEVAQLVGYK
jgi:uncharacterized protein YjbJ (UPF0337 family)